MINPLTLLTWARLPFLLHIIVEFPAAMTFTFRPHLQIPHATPDIKLILRGYGALLYSTLLLAGYFLGRSVQDDISLLFSLGMALYHVFPTYRAYARLRYGLGMQGKHATVMGGPRLHILVHALCFVGFSGAVWNGMGSSRVTGHDSS